MQQTSLSLLQQVQSAAGPDAWARLVDIYTPLLRAWLHRYDESGADVDDLVQDVLLTVAQELPTFQHDSRPGAFRAWLRQILVHRLRHFWRSRQHRPRVVGGSDFQQHLAELEDDASAVSRMWDREHDQHVLQRLLETLEPHFAAQTWQAFRRQMLDGASAEEVSRELAMPLHSVYAAKSRVLKALRGAAEGLVP
jgi:RNA polymerase sigma factor (sigma-70 family)